MAGAASQQTAGSCGRNRLTRCGTGDGGGTWGGGGVGDWRGRRCGTGDGGGGGGAGSKLERGNLVEMGWDKQVLRVQTWSRCYEGENGSRNSRPDCFLGSMLQSASQNAFNPSRNRANSHLNADVTKNQFSFKH